uniref:Adenylate kinase n=1 Tax=Thermofilum pendens TaxID=2269 RepID=A0A7C4H6C2_THEPE
MRGYSGRKLSENVESEVLGVVLSDAVSIFGENSVCEVDASGKSVEEILSLLLEIVTAEKRSERCRVGLVDWLKDYYWLLGREE